MIPARGHFLGVNANGYSLNSQALGDITYTTDIDSPNEGVALFATANPANFRLATRLDAIGPTGLIGDLYREGAGYAVYFDDDQQFALVRDLRSGRPKDTDNNAADFFIAEVTGDGDIEGPIDTGRRKLGAPGPENLSSPIERTAMFPAGLFSPTRSVTSAPNRVRDLTSNAANNAAYGTLTLRRRFTNNTGVPVTQLRFRIADLTTRGGGAAPPVGVADLRAVTSGDVWVTLVSGGNTLVRGAVLDAAPGHTMGGGLNNTLFVESVSVEEPIAPGASIDVQFVFGVQQSGQFVSSSPSKPCKRQR